MLALTQITQLQRLAAGVLASTALVVAIVGFAAQRTLANLIAGIQIAISQPIRIGDRISFEEQEGRVTDITLSYTYIDPGDGSSVVVWVDYGAGKSAPLPEALKARIREIDPQDP